MTRAGADRRKRSLDNGDQALLLGDDMAAFRAALGADFTVADAVAALSRCGGDTERAIRSLLDATAAEKGRAGGDAPVPGRRARGAKAERGVASPPLHPVKVEPADEVGVKVEMEQICADSGGVKVEVEAAGQVEAKAGISGEVGVKVKPEPIESDGPFQEQSGHQVKQEEETYEVDVKEEETDEVDVKEEGADEVDVKEEVGVKEEADEVDVKQEANEIGVKEEESDVSDDEVKIIEPPPRPTKKLRHEDVIDLTTSHPVPYLSARPVRALPPPGAVPVNEWRMVVAPPPAELDQRAPDHREWHLFRKSYATGLSTCRGRKLLDAGEVVHFASPSYDWLYGRARVSARQAAALSEIVRFSTNRSGEVLANPLALTDLNWDAHY